MNRSLCIWLAAWLFSFPLYASDLDTLSMKNIDLDEIVVRSFKQDKSFKKMPVAASSVSLATIEKRNITNIKEFSALVPNLFIPDYGSKLTSPVYIRGIGSKINSPSVGLYVDGIPYFEKSAFDFDFADIDRVEVLRGPQGTLYGRNTMGGIISIYTKSPFKYEGTNVSLGGGNYGNINGTFSHYGNINQNFGYSVSGNYKHSKGYFTNLYTREKADKLNSASGRFRLSWRASSQVDLHWVSTYEYSDQGGYPYAPYDESGLLGPVNYNEYSYYKRNMLTNGLTVDYKNDYFRLNLQTAYQYFDDAQGIDQDFSHENLYFAIQNQKQHQLSEELNIKSWSTRSYKWLVGAFAFYQQLDNEVILNYHQLDKSTRKLYQTPSAGAAIYHQSTFDDLLVNNLSLTLGIRYDIEHIRTTFDFYTIRNQATQNDKYDKKSLTFSQLTPKASLQYNFSDLQMAYFTVSKGYKAGGFNTSFDKEEDPSFKPEYSWNYETGVKSSFCDNRIRAEISLFYIDWRHQQIYQILPNGIGSRLKNAGKTVSKGVEVSLQANLFKNFNLQVNYGYTHATFKDYRKSDKEIYTGNYLPFVPSHTISAGADYGVDIRSAFLRKILVSAQYNGIGKLYWKENNKVSQPYYGLLNGKISFITHKFVTFDLWIKNATNASYNSFYFESVGQKLAQKGRPLTFGANLILNF